jgi:hypothetical protein
MDRIATAGLHQSILAANQDNLAHIALYQRQLASGKKIEQISDDPSAGRQLLRYRNDSAAAATYLAGRRRNRAPTAPPTLPAAPPWRVRSTACSAG